MPSFLNSAEAAAALGVSRQTLYAYVSRGLLSVHQAAAGNAPKHQRESRYLAEEVTRLASQRTRGRKPKEVAKAALNWGLPVLESGITLIEDGRLFYRGHDAVQLARHSSVEEVAALLWDSPLVAAFGSVEVSAHPAYASVCQHFFGVRAESAMLPLFTLASDDLSTAAWQTSNVRLAAGCGVLMRLLAASLLMRAPTSQPLHQQCAQAWQLDHDGAELVRMCLILCADHELNASSFTARCVASTDASVRAAMIAGLAALSGGKHGGTTARVEALLDEIGVTDINATASDTAQLTSKLQLRLARGESLAGFGHHLYPAGDVRATFLLASILPQAPALQACVSAAQELTGLAPSLDLALVAVRRHLRLPVGSAYGLFALGRGMGWIAQALEQRGNGDLIRPRAAYIGPRP